MLYIKDYLSYNLRVRRVHETEGDHMSMLLIRFFAVGSIAVCIPLLANVLGPRMSGYVATIPVVLIASMYFLGRDHGTAVVKGEAQGALLGLVGLVAFLAVLIYANGRVPQIAALALSLAAWVLVASLAQVGFGTWYYIASGVLTVTGARWLFEFGRRTPVVWLYAFVGVMVCGTIADHIPNRWMALIPMAPLAIMFMGGATTTPLDRRRREEALCHPAR